jgi:hypothetical protein
MFDKKVAAMALFVMFSDAGLAQSTYNQKSNLNTTNITSAPVCKRWTWSGDVYTRKVVCLEWADAKEVKK